MRREFLYVLLAILYASCRLVYTKAYLGLQVIHYGSNWRNCRLPRDLMEKMPSASNSPVMGRKLSGVESSENNSDSKTTKKVPLSVASMVRRFETSNPSKSRGGNGETRSERSPSQKIRDSESSLSSSPSSSQGHLNEIQDLQQTNLGSKSESNSDKKQITATKTNQNKTVSKNLIFWPRKYSRSIFLPFEFLSF